MIQYEMETFDAIRQKQVIEIDEMQIKQNNLKS